MSIDGAAAETPKSAPSPVEARPATTVRDRRSEAVDFLKSAPGKARAKLTSWIRPKPSTESSRIELNDPKNKKLADMTAAPLMGAEINAVPTGVLENATQAETVTPSLSTTPEQLAAMPRDELVKRAVEFLNAQRQTVIVVSNLEHELTVLRLLAAQREREREQQNNLPTLIKLLIGFLTILFSRNKRGPQK